MNRVLVIGLDGATFAILRPLVERGRLPNLAELLAKSASGTLLSTIPPVTPAAWTTFFTGKNPGIHGIFDFQRLDFNEYRFLPLDVHGLREKTIWEILGESGLRSIVWDVPFTYPPRPFNGWMLAGYGAPRTSGAVLTFPSDLAEQIPAELQSEMRLAQPEVRFERSRAFIREWQTIMAGRARLLKWLIAEQAWALFLFVFSITDNLAHVFWTYCEPTHPNFHRPEAEEYREAFYRSYETCDEILGELRTAAGVETTTLVISDHGFGSVRPRQYLFERLARGGYLRYRMAGGSRRRRVLEAATGFYLRHPALREWYKGLRGGLRRGLNRSIRSAGLLPESGSIDQAGSSIIPSHFGLGMWANSKDRFPGGLIAEEVKGPFLAGLESYLYDDLDPYTHKPVIAAIHDGAQIYRGPFAQNAPDRIIEYADTFRFAEEGPGNNPFTEGGHTPHGILLAGGPGIRAGKVEGGALADLAPTILHLLGQPIPPDMDGRVIAELFTPASLTVRPIRIGREPARWDSRPEDPGLTPEEARDVEEQLRRLGYV